MCFYFEYINKNYKSRLYIKDKINDAVKIYGLGTAIYNGTHVNVISNKIIRYTWPDFFMDKLKTSKKFTIKRKKRHKVLFLLTFTNDINCYI